MKNVLLLLLTSWLTGTAFAQQDKYDNQRELRGNGKLKQLNPQQQKLAMTGGEAAGHLIVTLKASDDGQTYNLLD